MSQTESAKAVQMQERVALYRQQHTAANRWAAGYGPIQHTLETQDRVFTMAEWLAAQGVQGDGVPLFEVPHAAEPFSSPGMWPVGHPTSPHSVHPASGKLAHDRFYR